MTEEGKRKKEPGVSTAMTVVIGSVIGAGAFFKPYTIYQATGGVSVIVTLVGLLVYRKSADA